jgi:hypothetical protein
MTSKVTLNLDEMKRLRRELQSFGAARVKVGIMGGGLRELDPSGARHAGSGLRHRLGSISRHGDASLNNPTLGLIHEFGTKQVVESTPSGETGPGAVATFEHVTHHAIPARSFLRMPLMTRLQTRIDEIGRGVWRAIVLKRGMLPALATLGTVARNLVDAAFASGGFGQWAPNTPATIRRKGSSAPLIDSAQLRKSVTYQVVRSAR